MDIITFLTQYRTEVLPFTEVFYQLYKYRADKIGKIPSDILAKLFQLHPKGKMHRGALVVLGYELAGGKDRLEAVKASIAWELCATTILVADDVIDGDTMRRGQTTIHKQWESYFKGINLAHYGESMGIVTAIIGFYLAPLALNQTHFSDSIKLKALNYLFESTIETGYGEALDISTAWQKIEDKKQSVQFIHQYKTVNYSAVSPLLFGVTLASCKNQKLLDNLTKYGEYLGKIFQIQDDILGSYGDPKLTGKSNESDIYEARWTMLIELLYQEGNVEDRQLLLSIFDKPKRNKADVKIVKNLFKKYDILTKVQTLAEALLTKGVKIIPLITTNKDYQDTLKNLLEFMIKREK